MEFILKVTLFVVVIYAAIITFLFIRKKYKLNNTDNANLKEMMDRLYMLENIIAMIPGNVYWMNKQGIYLGCNDNQAKLIGLASRKEIVGKRINLLRQ